MVNQYSSKCNNIITTSAERLESVFVCGSACTGEQFAAYLPPVIPREESIHNVYWKQNIHREATTLNHIFEHRQAVLVRYLDNKSFLFVMSVYVICFNPLCSGFSAVVSFGFNIKRDIFVSDPNYSKQQISL